MFCIDASVILSAVKNTELHLLQSKKFLAGVIQDAQKVFLPEIVLPEVTSGFVRATGNEVLISQFVENLRSIPHFSFVAVDSTLSNLTVNVILQTHLRASDAVYVALAYEYNLTLVTLDDEQLTKGSILVPTRRP